MRPLAFFAPAAVVLTLAGAASAQTVTVSLGAELQEKAPQLGEREVAQQVDRLTQQVERALADTPALRGARAELVLTRLEPNRPTFQQQADRPGLDPLRSASLGGARIEGRLILADGHEVPVAYEYRTPSIEDVRTYSTWHDAERTWRRFADNLRAGRYVSR